MKLEVELLNTFKQVVQARAGLSTGFEQDAVNTLVAPVTALANSVQALNAGVATVVNTTRGQVEFLKNELERVENNINDGIGRDMTAFNQAASRTPTLIGVARPSTFT